MPNKIWLASPHMSDEGYEKEFVKEAFDTNWIAPLGPNVNEFEYEFARKKTARIFTFVGCANMVAARTK